MIPAGELHLSTHFCYSLSLYALAKRAEKRDVSPSEAEVVDERASAHEQTGWRNKHVHSSAAHEAPQEVRVGSAA